MPEAVLDDRSLDQAVVRLAPGGFAEQVSRPTLGRKPDRQGDSISDCPSGSAIPHGSGGASRCV